MKKIVYIVIAVIVIAVIAVAISSKGPAGAPTVSQNGESATVAIKSVAANTSLAGVAAADGSRTIEWVSGNYPSNVGVDINLIRKISDSPVSYDFVRKLAANTENDGSENWIPAEGETGDDLYIEVTCASGVSFNAGCQISSSPVKAY